MTKKVDETLKKTGIEKKKTNLKISRKTNSKATKKVILETPILEQIPEKKSKRTISRKKPEPKAIGSLNVAPKTTITSPTSEQKNPLKNIKSMKTISISAPSKPQPKEIEKIDIKQIEISKNKNEKTTKTKKSNTTLTPNTPMPNSKKNSRILDNKQILVKPKRTLKLNIGNRITPMEDEKINSIIGFSDIPIVEASPIPKKNVSINQNSSFFYEPSIFEKFDITVSNIDEESSNINNDVKETQEVEISQISVENEIPEDNTQIIENEVSVDQTEIEEQSQNNIDDQNINIENEKVEENENVEEELINALLDEIIEEQLAKSTTEVETEAETDSEPELELESESETEVESESEPELESELETEPKVESESEPELEIESELESELEAEPEAESFDFISNEIPEELKETFEKNLELTTKKQKFIEDASNEYDFISTETPDIYKPYFSSNDFEIENENIDETETELEPVSENIENEVIDENSDNNSNISITDNDIPDEIFEADNIISSESESNSEILINNEIDFAQTDDEIMEHYEAADNLITDEILKETQEKATDTAIGKFFDSSIPSMSQEADSSYFTKIKKSLFSNISTVFKKFSFEEASLLNSEKETFEEATPIIELGKPSSSDNIKQVLENFDNTETNLNNLDVSASQNTLVLPTIDEKILEAKEVSPESVQDVITNIVTPPTVSNEDISLDDIDLDEIDINDLELSDIEDILNQNDEQNNIENIENDEEILDKEQSSDIIEELYDDKENLDNEISENSDETSDSEDFQELDETIEDDFYSKFTEQNNEIDDENVSEFEDDVEDELESLSEEDIDEELNEFLGIEPTEPEDDEESFSIEEYFGVTPKEPEDDDEDFIEEFEDDDDIEEDEPQDIYQEKLDSFSKLIENFTQTISTLSNKISELETNISTNENNSVIEQDKISEEPLTVENDVNLNDDNNENNIENTDVVDNLDVNNEESVALDTISEPEKDTSDINLEDISIDDISLDDISLEDLEALDDISIKEEPSLLPIENEIPETSNSVEDILLKAFDNPEINDQMKHDLLSEVLSVEEELPTSEENTSEPVETETTSDFFKIIDSLSKTISELEKAPDFAPKSSEKIDVPTSIIEEKNVVPSSPASTIEEENIIPVSEESITPIEEIAPVPENTSDKAINILINKDDIFSIAILNETYEIVTDFDGISVISENIHISTPKNNFYVNIGDKYIEIHKQPDLFVVNTNFEDIEFANAINNVTFAKKKNKIELNIKAAFKISSVNKKIELSMLNTSIANLTGSQENSDDNSSICDNKTLVINEETQKVYLPYNIEDVMKKLNNSSDYQSLEDVIEEEYTLPLSTFKMPIISRFKEAYRFMRTKEKSSVYAALDLAVELMFNSNLNPAVIRASKDLKELNIYLDCLYENELEKFDCFKVIYKVLPKIQ